MTYHTIKAALFTIVLGAASTATAEQFVVELSDPLTGSDTALRQSLKLTEIERFDASGKSYVVFDAKDEAVLETFFYVKSIDPLKIKKVEFVNSPTVGGGPQPGAKPMPGHQVFVIERPIPGVGSFPIEKKAKISRGSNAAIAKMGSVIEWDHSYLTDEGTYCVYRATDENKIVEHGTLSGAPIRTITAVTQTKPTSN